jgi:2-keto-3-deoxy-L-rhamnonate aldolase RhmA
MTPTNLRAATDPLIGTLVTTASEEHAEALAGCGLDWLFIDAEHGPLDIGDIQRVVRAAGNDILTLVRVPEASGTWIERVLGTGCSGVIIPKVNAAAEARDLVEAAKYPPVGTRGVGPMRAQGYGNGTAADLAAANANVLVVVQAEHIDAVHAIDEIVAVDGVSAVFIGPYDLSASMGLPGEFTHPDVVAAIARIRDACTAVGMPVGIFAGNLDRAREVSEGTTLLAVGTDLSWLTGAVRAMAAALRPE